MKAVYKGKDESIIEFIDVYNGGASVSIDNNNIKVKFANKEINYASLSDFGKDWDMVYDNIPKEKIEEYSVHTKYPIVCICGSTKFKDEFYRSAKFYEALGYIVLTTHLFSHADGLKLSESMIAQLKQMYGQMIEMCDELHVVNVNDYIGENTAIEIEYAKSLGKSISFAYPHIENR